MSEGPAPAGVTAGVPQLVGDEDGEAEGEADGLADAEAVALGDPLAVGLGDGLVAPGLDPHAIVVSKAAAARKAMRPDIGADYPRWANLCKKFLQQVAGRFRIRLWRALLEIRHQGA